MVDFSNKETSMKERKNLVVKFLFRLLTGLILVNGSQAYAVCTCERVSMELSLRVSAHVFEATIASIEQDDVALVNPKIYKGQSFSTVKVKQSPCPPQLQKGARMVFFLNSNEIKSECESHFLVDNKILFQNFKKILEKNK